MPRFCANISLLFQELPLTERFEAAARAGFRAVEIQFPYSFDRELLAARAASAGVEVVLINMPAGDFEHGERGIACLPARGAEFRESVKLSVEYARAMNCRRINCLAGIAPAAAKPSSLRRSLLANVRFAAAALRDHGMDLMLEPQNTRTFPGVFLRNTAQALALMDDAGADNVRLQYDLFHMQIMEGDLARTLAANVARIGHIQIADVPGRHEPGTGELNFPFLFRWMDEIGYTGWVGAEYQPAAGTEAGLGWARPYLHAN